MQSAMRSVSCWLQMSAKTPHIPYLYHSTLQFSNLTGQKVLIIVTVSIVTVIKD